MKLINKLLVFFIFSVLCIYYVYGQQALIVFNSDSNIKVTIYKPVDEACDFINNADILEIKPNISVLYRLDIADYCFIKLNYSNGLSCSLIILENDEVEVSLKDNRLIFKGNNAEGNVYLNNSTRYAAVDSIFDLHIPSPININAINADLYETFWQGFYEDINTLKSNANVSADFIRLLSNDFGFAIAEMLVQDYQIVLSGAKGKVSSADSLQIALQIDSIYQKYTPWLEETLKYRYSNLLIDLYYRSKYNDLSLPEKEQLFQQYGSDTFGPYSPYLLAPPKIQRSKFGRAFMIQLEWNVDEFNTDKMLNYIETNFYDSQYLQLIKNKLIDIQSQNNLVSENNDSIIFINEQIDTLQELFSLNSFVGNSIFIDLWATWCLPCVSEFRYKSELNKIAAKYNVKLVYLSIDNESFRKKWESDIYKYNLSGYHLLVNKLLLEDIEKNIYKNQPTIIPRYLYINNNREIVNDDASGPSAINEIEKLFSAE